MDKKLVKEVAKTLIFFIRHPLGFIAFCLTLVITMKEMKKTCLEKTMLERMIYSKR